MSDKDKMFKTPKNNKTPRTTWGTTVSSKFSQLTQGWEMFEF